MIDPAADQLIHLFGCPNRGTVDGVGSAKATSESKLIVAHINSDDL